MTNREWLESLSDKQLAEFLTDGIAVTFKSDGRLFSSFINIYLISNQYTQSTIGIEHWLKETNCYSTVDWSEIK